MEFLLIVLESAGVMLCVYLAYMLVRGAYELVTDSVSERKANKLYGKVEGKIVDIRTPAWTFYKHGFLYKEIVIQKKVDGKTLERIVVISPTEDIGYEIGQNIQKDEKGYLVIVD